MWCSSTDRCADSTAGAPTGCAKRTATPATDSTAAGTASGGDMRGHMVGVQHVQPVLRRRHTEPLLHGDDAGVERRAGVPCISGNEILQC